MPLPTEKEFDDPVLKEAVRRCWGCDCASSELQKKIAGLLRVTPAAAEGHHRSLTRLSWFLLPLALAACALLAVGLFHHLPNHPADVASVLPVALENDLIHRHDFCCKLPNHQHLPAPKTDDTAIAAALHERLNQAVMVYHPQDPDWQFRGAAVCPVGTTPAGHLVFVKGTDALSIFSLPKSMIPAASEGTEYTSSANQHCIVAFVKQGALFCLVSSGPPGDVSIEDLKKMESQMQPTVAQLNPPEKAPVLLTDLLRPVGP